MSILVVNLLLVIQSEFKSISGCIVKLSFFFALNIVVSSTNIDALLFPLEESNYWYTVWRGKALKGILVEHLSWFVFDLFLFHSCPHIATYLSLRKPFIISWIGPLYPYFSIFCNTILWSSMSNAFCRSMKKACPRDFLSICVLLISVTNTIASMQDLFVQKP